MTQTNNTPPRRPSEIVSLRTSRAAADQERGVLAILRGLAPRRSLSLAEVEIVAERQANRLLQLSRLRRPPVPAALISELPRVRVQLDPELDESGRASWNGGRWQIVLRGSDSRLRQRATLAHEYKHTIDHRWRSLLYRDGPKLSADALAEHAADYFSTCLLMPRSWLEGSWEHGHRRLSELCAIYQVSPPVMSRRLQELGLRSPMAQPLPTSRRSRQKRGGGTVYSRPRAPREVSP